LLGKQGVDLKVCEAAKDYKYLLNRGYGQKASLDLVTSRYILSNVERALLLRCVHSDEDVVKIRSKHVDDVEHLRVVVDGYNALLTITSALEGRELYICDDGIVRDLRKSYSKGFTDEQIIESFKILYNEVTYLKPQSIKLVLDKNVSWSAKHAELIKSLITHNQVKKYDVTIVLATKADVTVMAEKDVIASSDYVILTKAERIFDVAGYIIRRKFPTQLVDFQQCFT